MKLNSVRLAVAAAVGDVARKLAEERITRILRKKPVTWVKAAMIPFMAMLGEKFPGRNL